MCILLFFPAPFGAGSKTRLEFRTKEFKPHLIYRLDNGARQRRYQTQPQPHVPVRAVRHLYGTMLYDTICMPQYFAFVPTFSLSKGLLPPNIMSLYGLYDTCMGCTTPVWVVRHLYGLYDTCMVWYGVNNNCFRDYFRFIYFLNISKFISWFSF